MRIIQEKIIRLKGGGGGGEKRRKKNELPGYSDSC